MTGDRILTTHAGSLPNYGDTALISCPPSCQLACKVALISAVSP